MLEEALCNPICLSMSNGYCPYHFEAWPCFENIELPSEKGTGSVFKSGSAISCCPNGPIARFISFQLYKSQIGNFVTRFMEARDVTKLLSWSLLLGMNTKFPLQSYTISPILWKYIVVLNWTTFEFSCRISTQVLFFLQAVR